MYVCICLWLVTAAVFWLKEPLFMSRTLCHYRDSRQKSCCFLLPKKLFSFWHSSGCHCWLAFPICITKKKKKYKKKIFKFRVSFLSLFMDFVVECIGREFVGFWLQLKKWLKMAAVMANECSTQWASINRKNRNN